MLPLIGSLGTTELLIILGIIILLFGATKLPDLARGSGRALRIFRAETKGLIEDDGNRNAAPAESESRELESRLDHGAPGQGEADAQDRRLGHPDNA